MDTIGGEMIMVKRRKGRIASGVVMCACVILLYGCTGQDEYNRTESISSNISEEENTQTKPEVMHFYDEYSRNQIEKNVSIYEEISSSGEGADYGRVKVVLSPLFDDENISSLEYFIENGNGSFMDDADFGAMKKQEKNKKVEEVRDISDVYRCSLDGQKGLYFTQYYNIDANLSNSDATIVKQNILKKICLKVNVTYKDGTVVSHSYVLDFKYDYNITNVQIYELVEK